MCTNTLCPLSQDCGRFSCQPNEFWQAYSHFEPYIDEEDDVACEYYMEEDD